jgi:hypothetical protein
MTRTKSARYLESCHNHHNHVSRQKRRKEKGGGGRFFKNKSKVRRYKRDGSEYQGKEVWKLRCVVIRGGRRFLNPKSWIV